MDMKEQLSKIQTSFKQFWDAQEKKRKIAYIAVLVAIVLIAVIVAIILNKKDYVVLYEGLETAEASEIAAQIQELGYDVSLKSGGTVTVLKGTEDTLTMQMAQLGYPKSNLTYELYTSNVDMFSTESEKKEYARMALESRLSAIIGSLEGVEKATVTLSIPEQKNTVISSLRQYPTAAVVVYLAKNVTLTNEQIEGITHIVQMSYSGLAEENISITDSYGIPQIAGETPIDVVADETRKFAFKTNLENTIKNKILELLIPIYGEDGVSVAVNSVLDFDKKVSENTNYSADGNGNTGVLQHGDATEASGGTTVDGGVVGVETNADDTYPTGDTNGNGAWSESSVSNTYLVDTYKEQIEKAGADIESLSIAVVVYTDYISEAQKLDLVNLVANAGGVNPEVAQEVVTVTNFPKFDDTLEIETAPVYLFGLTFNQLVAAAAILLILLIIIAVILLITSRSAKTKRMKFEQQVLAASAAEEGPENEIVDTFNLNLDGSPVEVPSLLDSGEETKETVIRREISDFAKNSPDIVAQLLKNWMKEEGED
ncbi:MAG: flagellar basal-body MS-ring/collar protein FliF [Oscillospiraceae bacterium]